MISCKPVVGIPQNFRLIAVGDKGELSRFWEKMSRLDMVKRALWEFWMSWWWWWCLFRLWRWQPME